MEPGVLLTVIDVGLGIAMSILLPFLNLKKYNRCLFRRIAVSGI